MSHKNVTKNILSPQFIFLSTYLILCVDYYFYGAYLEPFLLAVLLMSVMTVTVYKKIEKKLCVEIFLLFFCVISSVLSIRFGTFGGLYFSATLFLQFLLVLNIFCIKEFFRFHGILRLIDGSLQILLYFCLLYFFSQFFLKGIGSSNANSYIELGSRNIASAVLIYVQITYSCVHYFNSKKSPLVTPFLTFFVCIILYGRTGIALSGAWLFVSVIFRCKLRIYYLFFASMVLMSFLFYFFEYMIDYILKNSKFSHGFDSVRFEMWAQYATSLDFFTMLFGQNYLISESIMTDGAGSPHNSFIAGHHFMGLPYLVFILLIVLRPLFHIDRNNFFVLIGFYFLIFRAGWDVFALPGYFSVFPFILYLLVVMGNGFPRCKVAVTA